MDAMMSRRKLYPLLFEPVYKNYIWGGTRIAERFGRAVPSNTAAESWEISSRREGMSVVSNGPLAGKTLEELMRKYGSALVGREVNVFPLLIKIIDAKQRLSVQVHPDEIAAAKYGGEPKTEAWHILEAEPDAAVFAGFTRKNSEAELRKALASGSVEQLLRRVPVRRGDILFMPGGRIHSIDAGVLLLEVQQNSNTTFRLYDWDRRGADGRPRPLHVEQALRVIRWDDTGPDARAEEGSQHIPKQNAFTELLRCPHFTMEQAKLSGELDCAIDSRSFHALFLETGSARISTDVLSVEVKAGESVLLPAASEQYRIESPAAELIRVRL